MSNRQACGAVEALVRWFPATPIESKVVVFWLIVLLDVYTFKQRISEF